MWGFKAPLKITGDLGLSLHLGPQSCNITTGTRGILGGGKRFPLMIKIGQIGDKKVSKLRTKWGQYPQVGSDRHVGNTHDGDALWKMGMKSNKGHIHTVVTSLKTSIKFASFNVKPLAHNCLNCFVVN